VTSGPPESFSTERPRRFDSRAILVCLCAASFVSLNGNSRTGLKKLDACLKKLAEFLKLIRFARSPLFLELGAFRVGTVLSSARSTIDRSGADDPDAHRRLRVRDPRSERALCRDVKVNLAYRWFCGLSIEDRVPDHSAFSRARNERFRDSGIFRSVFERVVGACIAAGLVGGEGFAVDASLIVADANKQRSIPGKQWSKELDAQVVSQATKEYLATLDDAAFGAASEVTPKFVSPSDPAAQWTGAMRGPAFFAYSDNYLVDVKSGIIMERAERRFDIKPTRLAADTAYGSGSTLNWLVNRKKIAPHIPVIDKSNREDGTFSRVRAFDFRVTLQGNEKLA
jgi:hypothetical protein